MKKQDFIFKSDMDSLSVSEKGLVEFITSTKADHGIFSKHNISGVAWLFEATEQMGEILIECTHLVSYDVTNSKGFGELSGTSVLVSITEKDSRTTRRYTALYAGLTIVASEHAGRVDMCKKCKFIG